MKYNQRNPRTNSFYWRGSVISIGRKDFIDQEASNAHIQVIESDGNVSFVPVVQREDPDLTPYENISQILLGEEVEPQQAKRVKLITSSQKDHKLCFSTNELDNSAKISDGADQDLYVTINPGEVPQCVSQLEQGKTSNVEIGADGNELTEFPDLNSSNRSTKGNKENFEKPKFSATPANRKVKTSRAINPEDITQMEVRHADMEAANAIKEAAQEIKQAAVLIVNCMQELKPDIKALANRNYREIQMSSNAVEQLVSDVAGSKILFQIELPVQTITAFLRITQLNSFRKIIC